MKKLLLVLGALVALIGVVLGVLALVERKGSHKPLTAIKGGLADIKTRLAAFKAAKATPKV